MKWKENKPPFIIVLVILLIIVTGILYYYHAPPAFYLSILQAIILVLLFLAVKKDRDKIIAQKKTASLIDLNKQLEEQVKQKTSALQDIFERVSDAFVAIDNQWRYTYLNKKADELLRHTNQPPGSLAGKPVFDVIPEAEGSVFHKKAQEAMNTRQYRYAEDYDPRYDRWFENHIYPSDDGLSVFFRDITARKKAEEALRVSEEKYRMIIEQASESIFIYTSDWKCIDANTNACNMTGYSKKELQEIDILSLVSPEDLQENPPKMAKIKAGEIVSSERKLKRKDGTVFYAESFFRQLSDGRIISFVRDTTERKVSEDALRKSKEEYITLVNTIDGIVWEANAQTFQFNFVSRQAERLLGYPVQRWINEPDFWNQHIYEEDRAFAVEFCVNSTRAKESHTFEYRMVAADGHLVWIRDIVSVILENDMPVKLRGIMIDITGQKEVEIKLREAEEKFRNLVEESLVGVYILQDGRFAYINPKIAEIYGYIQDEITGQPLSLLADEDQMEKINENIRLRLSGERDSVHYEIVGKRKDRSYINVEVFGSKTLYKGRSAIIGTLIDITERKKIAEELTLSREKYKLLFDRSPLPMFMYTTPDYFIIDVNDAAVQHYGYTKEEFLNMNLRDLRPPEDILRFLEVAAMPASGSLGIWRHKRKDGTIIDVEIIAHDIIYQGMPARLALTNDVTEKLEAEKRLNQSYKEIRMLASHLEQIREEEKIKIAREIHDELGQKLTTLKMDISWLTRKIEMKDEIIKEKIQEIFNTLDETVKTLRRIATELRPGILDDIGLVAAMEWQSGEFEKRSGIKSEFRSVKEDLKLPINLSTGLFRIFQESLTNVARHSEARHVTTTLDKINDEIILKISDDGRGFDVSSIGPKRTLGLLGMKERTMMMGGKYELISKPGAGTTVVISVNLSAPKLNLS